MLPPQLSIVIAYLTGSIPVAYLAGRWKGVDLRRHGSGNLGATNVVRVLGVKIGVMVFLADAAKGFLPVYVLSRHTTTSHPNLFALALGAAAMLGHVRPVFLLGRGGGKGVATAAGAFLGVAWLPTVLACAAWLIVFLIWRYVSLASLVAAAVLPVALLLTGTFAPRDPAFIAALLITLFVFYTHRANIGRLYRGEEHSFRHVRGVG